VLGVRIERGHDHEPGGGGVVDPGASQRRGDRLLGQATGDLVEHGVLVVSKRPLLKGDLEPDVEEPLRLGLERVHRGEASAPRAVRGDVARQRPGSGEVRAVLVHDAAQDVPDALLGPDGGALAARGIAAQRVVVRGSLHRAGEERALHQIELRRLHVEEVARADPEAAPVRRHVELVRVELQDAGLVVVLLQAQRVQQLDALAPQRSIGAMKDVLRRLLGQRRTAGDHAPRGHVVEHRPRDVPWIDAPVRPELAVLGRDDRHLPGERDLVERGVRPVLALEEHPDARLAVAIEDR
jgi:hypothetical protein